jgi:hypothetical protein
VTLIVTDLIGSVMENPVDLVELQNIKDELKDIKNMMQQNQIQCKRMCSHIDFVEGVYLMLKAPLQWLVYAWHRMPIKHIHTAPYNGLSWLPSITHK